MFGKHSQSQAKPTQDGNPLGGLTFVMGAMFAFFLTPLVFAATSEVVAAFTAEHYGTWMIGIAKVLSFILSGAGIFFLSRALSGYLIRLAGFYFTLLSARSRY